MAEVLVLAEHTADGEVKKVTLELLTAARRLGEPSVVWTGPGADAAQPRLAEYGAAGMVWPDAFASANSELAKVAAERALNYQPSLIANRLLLAGQHEPLEPVCF